MMGLHDIQKPAPHVASYADLARLVAHLGRLVQRQGDRIAALEAGTPRARQRQQRAATKAKAIVALPVASVQPSGVVSVASIVARVAAVHRVSVAQIIGPERHAALVRARHQAWLEAREAGHSLSHIGRVCHRDHATVFYGVLRAAQRRSAAAGADIGGVA